MAVTQTWIRIDPEGKEGRHQQSYMIFKSQQDSLAQATYLL